MNQIILKITKLAYPVILTTEIGKKLDAFNGR
jgi:hypothetical protein